MKSPWKFIAQLTTRRQKKEPLQITSTEDRPVSEEAAPIETPAPVTDLVATPETSAQPDRDEQATPDVAERPEPEIDQVATDGASLGHEPIEHVKSDQSDERDVEDKIAVPENERSPSVISAPQTRRRARPKRSPAPEIVETTAVAAPEPVVQPPISKKTFFDELVELDNEIAQLRLALAEKLRLQNAQLRKMLERYGDR